jgi:outer membrane lipoprotein SlyB
MRKNIGFRLSAAALLFVLAACSQTWNPVVDMQTPGFDNARYSGDLAYCRQLAAQVSPAEEGLIGALAGGALGAATGAALGAATGNVGAGAAIGAAGAGVLGAGAGVAHGASSQMDIIRNCLRGRGYNVLN